MGLFITIMIFSVIVLLLALPEEVKSTKSLIEENLFIINRYKYQGYDARLGRDWLYTFKKFDEAVIKGDEKEVELLGKMLDKCNHTQYKMEL